MLQTIKIGDRVWNMKEAATARYAVVLTTFERTGLSRPSQNKANDYRPGVDENTYKWTRGLPDTWQYNGANEEQNSHVVLTPALQNFWFDECVKLCPGRSLDFYYSSWRSLTDGGRWQTNGFGSGTNADYVTSEHLTNEPMRYFTLLTGRAILEITGAPKNIYGTLSFPFRAINANAPLAGITYQTHPYLFYFPVNSVRTPLLNQKGQWLNGRIEYKEDGYGRFPQFDGRAITPLFMPHTDVGWIDANSIRLLQPGEPFPPAFNL